MAPVTDKVQESKKCWRFTLTVERMLSALEMLDREDLLPEVKTREAARLLVRGRVDEKDAAKALKIAFELIQKDESKHPSSGPQVISFTQDWGYIKAAFLQAYGIDLIKEARRMHWCNFIDLLRAVPDSTRLAKIVEIRATPLPKPTKYNAEERARLSKLKAQYAIKSTKSDVVDGLKGLFGALAAQAKGR